MKNHLFVIFCASILFTIPLAEVSHAQTEEDALRFTQRWPATGARALGMGGVGAAGIADWSAVYTNPAGLGWMNTSELTGALTHVASDDEASFQLPGFDQTETARLAQTGLSNISYAYRFPTVRGSLVIGAGYNQVNTFNRSLIFEGENTINSITDYFMPLPGEFEIVPQNGDVDVIIHRTISLIGFEAYGIDFDWQAYDAGDPVPFYPAVLAGPIVQRGEVLEEGRRGEFSLVGAFEASQGVMVGVAANVTSGQYRLESIFVEDDFFDANDGTGGTADFDFLELTDRLDADLFGVNLRAGVSGHVTDALRLGLSLETPTYMSVGETYSTRLVTVFDDGFTASYGGQSGDAGTGEFDYRITTPWRISAGGAYQIGQALISADLEYIDWSQMRMSADTDRAYFDDLNRTIRNALGEVVNVRAGAEYMLGDLALRAGVAHHPDPRTNSPDIDRSRNYFSAGVGYRFSDQFRLDLGWMQERFDDRYLPYTEVANAPVVDEQVVRNQLLIGARVTF